MKYELKHLGRSLADAIYKKVCQANALKIRMWFNENSSSKMMNTLYERCICWEVSIHSCLNILYTVSPWTLLLNRHCLVMYVYELLIRQQLRLGILWKGSKSESLICWLICHEINNFELINKFHWSSLTYMSEVSIGIWAHWRRKCEWWFELAIWIEWNLLIVTNSDWNFVLF